MFYTGLGNWNELGLVRQMSFESHMDGWMHVSMHVRAHVCYHPWYYHPSYLRGLQDFELNSNVFEISSSQALKSAGLVTTPDSVMPLMGCPIGCSTFALTGNVLALAFCLLLLAPSVAPSSPLLAMYWHWLFVLLLLLGHLLVRS